MKYLRRYAVFLLTLSSFVGFINLQALNSQIEHDLYINDFKANPFLSTEKKRDFENLITSISNKSEDTPSDGIYHRVKSINLANSEVTLEDNSRWSIGWWYTGVIKSWHKGNRLKISCHSGNSNYICLENQDVSNTAWGSIAQLPDLELGDFIEQIQNSKKHDEEIKFVFKSGWILEGPSEFNPYKNKWKVKDRVFIFRSSEFPNLYDVWNTERNLLVRGWSLVGKNKSQPYKNPDLVESFKKDSLFLEDRLNKRVLDQHEATKQVSAFILNYAAGLKDPKTPIGVFLFIGPTGVGKTELAKALTDILYKDQKYLIRFDMSHFSDSYTSIRLIGTPPGYVDNEQGGQLTEALKEKPQSVVLLDEIEKAHPQVIKLFLPVFDEGYITDANDVKVICNQVVFIMTSNICAEKIAFFYSQGLESHEILKMIEPELISILSPELYNRVEPILFHPISFETMTGLVDLMLQDVVNRIKSTKSIDLIIDGSVREYLIENGFHPTLGARPLKKLIEKKVLAALSYAIISEQIQEGSTLIITYSKIADSWHVNSRSVNKKETKN